MRPLASLLAVLLWPVLALAIRGGGGGHRPAYDLLSGDRRELGSSGSHNKADVSLIQEDGGGASELSAAIDNASATKEPSDDQSSSPSAKELPTSYEGVKTAARKGRGMWDNLGNRQKFKSERTGGQRRGGQSEGGQRRGGQKGKEFWTQLADDSPPSLSSSLHPSTARTASTNRRSYFEGSLGHGEQPDHNRQVFIKSGRQGNAVRCCRYYCRHMRGGGARTKGLCEIECEGGTAGRNMSVIEMLRSPSAK